MTEVVLILATGVVAGVFSGVLGIGGAAVLIPALVIGFGLGQVEAQATALATLVPTTAAGAIAYARRGAIDRRAVLRLVAAGVPGAMVGAYLALQIPGDALARIFAAFLLVAAYRLWASTREASAPEPVG